MSQKRYIPWSYLVMLLVITAVFIGTGWVIILDHRTAHDYRGPEDPRYNHIDLNCYITRAGDSASAVVMDPKCREVLSEYCDWYPGPSTALDMP